MKERKSRRMFGWILAAAILLVVLVQGLLWFFDGRLERLENKIENWADGVEDTMEQELRGQGFTEAAHGTKEIHTVQIEWTAGDVRIERGDGDEITFFETESSEPMVWDEENGVLTILFRKEGIHLHAADKALTVQIPETVELKQLRVSTTSADVAVEVDLPQLSLDSVSGDLTAGGNFGELHADTTSGSVTITGTARDVEADTVSGSVELRMEQTPDEITADTTSGSVTVAIPEDRSFEAEFDTVSGRYTCEHAPVRGNEAHYTGTSTDRPAELDFDTVSGNVEIVVQN